MRLRKALAHLRYYISGYGLIKGVRILFLRKSHGREPVRLHSSRMGGTVWVRPGTADLNIYDQIALEPYQPLDLDDPPGTIVDCGANIGFSTRFFKAAYPNARVIAIEPEPGNYALLKKNTEHLPDVETIMAGVWPESGRIHLQHEGLGTSAYRTEQASGQGDTEAITIPHLLQRFGLQRIDLLKVDIEGAELDLFGKGDRSWLYQVDRVSVELHDHFRPGAGQAVLDALREHGTWTYEIFHGVLMCRRMKDGQPSG